MYGSGPCWLENVLEVFLRFLNWIQISLKGEFDTGAKFDLDSVALSKFNSNPILNIVSLILNVKPDSISVLVSRLENQSKLGRVKDQFKVVSEDEYEFVSED